MSTTNSGTMNEAITIRHEMPENSGNRTIALSFFRIDQDEPMSSQVYEMRANIGVASFFAVRLCDVDPRTPIARRRDARNAAGMIPIPGQTPNYFGLP